MVEPSGIACDLPARERVPVEGTDARCTPPCTPSSDVLLAELAAAFDATGEAFAIVSRTDRRIVWCSAGCRGFHPGLAPGRAVTDIAGLARSIDALEAGERPEPFALADAASGPCHGSLVHAGEARLVFRLHHRARSDDYLQRYVAEREKLFMVSRSVSVSEMATTLAHELNQPIGTITNLLQGLQVLLAREHGDEVPERLAQALARACDQARFAAGIIARVRSFTEARAPRLVACEAGQLVAGTVELLDWVFRSEAVSVRVRIEETPLHVSGDRILLQQVFANLLRNAVDAMRERPRGARRIRARVARDVDGVRIEIRDNGTGLAGAADAPFEPFRSTKRDGMGIGLNICRSFIEMHRGKLWLTPGPDGGCVAHVLLPERSA